MSSGIHVADKCAEEFGKMKKLDQTKPRPRCIIFKISDDKKEIIIDEIIIQDPEVDQETQYTEIVNAKLPDTEGRYVVWDLKIPNPKSGGEADKLIFMSWSPDSAKVQARMMFASSKKYLKEKLIGISTTVDCNERDDTLYKEIVKAAIK